MDFVLFMWEGAASIIPVSLVFFAKIFKVNTKATALVLLLVLFLSVFYWVKLNDLSIVIRFIPFFFLSFVWLLFEHIASKRGTKQ